MIEPQPAARFFLNRALQPKEIGASASRGDPLSFHRRMPGYAPTPLLRAPQIARALGVGEVLIKNESRRLGLPAFKILGASWAVYRALETRLGCLLENWKTTDDLARLRREITIRIRPIAIKTTPR